MSLFLPDARFAPSRTKLNLGCDLTAELTPFSITVSPDSLILSLSVVPDCESSPLSFAFTLHGQVSFET